jgi:hypothetical protein
VTLAPRPGVDGHVEVGAVIEMVGAVDVVTVADPVFEQPPTVTVTPSTTLPDEPAVKVIAFVLFALVIVPFVIDQP